MVKANTLKQEGSKIQKKVAKNIKKANKITVSEPKDKLTLELNDRNVTVVPLPSVISDSLFTIEPSNLFQALIYPITPQRFFRDIYTKKALVIRSNVARLPEVKEALFNLKLKKMLKETASEEVHVWQPTKSKGKITSFGTHHWDEAYDAHKQKRASLYFGCSLEMRTQWCKQLLYQMGYGISGYFPGTANDETCGDTTGEIETFVSCKGNKTDWHMDFQENFTIQVKGSKKWRFCVEEGMAVPRVGYTPHFKNDGALEVQDRVHKAFQGVDIAQIYNSNSRNVRCTEVTLNEGDILYHPAGIWHAVEANEDSISINFSLRHQSKADIVTNALNMIMLKDKSMREPIRLTDKTTLLSEIERALKQTKKALTSLKAEMICAPQAMSVPRQQVISLEKPLQASMTKIKLPAVVKRNPLYVVTDIENVPQSTDTGFLVSGLFGNADHEPITQVILSAKSKELKSLLRNLPAELRQRDYSGDVRQILVQVGLYY